MGINSGFKGLNNLLYNRGEQNERNECDVIIKVQNVSLKPVI